jgi:hypothetical protein
MTYIDFTLYMSREPNRQMLREVHSLPLEDQLQANRGARRFWPEDLVAVVRRFRSPPAADASRR